VLGPLLETALRRSLILSDGSFLIFLERPISAVFIVFACMVLSASLFAGIRVARGLGEDD
jgi:putative tricarboxylic transport membrane protein